MTPLAAEETGEALEPVPGPFIFYRRSKRPHSDSLACLVRSPKRSESCSFMRSVTAADAALLRAKVMVWRYLG